jgi:SnoaL-like domain
MQAVIDELAIRRVLDEYCLRLEFNAFDEWMYLFTEDTVYEVYKLVLRGRQEVTETISSAPHGTHIGGPMRISIEGDRAETIQNYLFVATNADEWNVGWYHRTLVRTGQGWKISHTRVKIGRKDDLAANERAHKIGYPITFS